nr:hypothetical protein [Ulva partita]BAV58267.1 hypothetical protein [Ulva partita]BAV58270.1 hypothetical protein [Ulva partita]
MKQTALPECLRTVPVEVLENYVGSQIAMFANGLAHRLGQHGYHIPTDVYKESAREVFQLLISEPSPRRTIARPQDLQLVFRHDCLALGCLVPSCKLCKHNPSRRCAVNFDKKYLVNDILKAKCQAVIRVEIVERATNQPVEDASFRDDIILQMAILDGNTYDAKFEAGMEGDFESCLLLMNNKGTPTLVGTAVSNDPHGFIRVPLVGSRAVLPDLRVTDSSEAMLSGRKPPLRLMMRAVYKDSLLPVPHVRHAISEGFVVA